MKNRPTSDQNEMKSACEVLQEILENSFNYSDSRITDRVTTANTITTITC